MTDREVVRHLAQVRAAEIWASMTPSERTGVRFGLLPAALMRAATAEGHDARMLSVALMDCASKDGGMRA